MNRQKPHRRYCRASDEGGFTLIEMLVAMSILALLFTLAAGALRNYWLTQALYGGRDEVISQLRAMQEQVVSENHPLVFGARFELGSGNWGLVEYDPRTGACTERPRTFSSSVTPTSATFLSTTETAACKNVLVYEAGAPLAGTPVPNRSASSYVWFYARGTATEGTATFTQPLLGDKSLTIRVTPLTGRVEPV